MSELLVHAYNVGFGDAVLVCVPDRDVVRHILIDGGNVGRDGKVFESVLKDIRARLCGKPLDLYVMTHEHLDHVKGAPTLAALDVDYAWLTASAEGDAYYAKHERAQRKKRLAEAAFEEIQARLHVDSITSALLANNNPHGTNACVGRLRTWARKTRYVHRKTRLRAGVDHPFREAKFRILAPEADTSDYYGRMTPIPKETKKAPKGVDQKAFDRLLASWRRGLLSNLLAIDRAANNTSLVFELEWRGWRLLFAGDAELRSWRTMERENVLAPVHFRKVGHHGSHNATPPDSILERIFPLARQHDTRKRTALISTCCDVYPGVPDDDTMIRLEARCDEIVRTDKLPGRRNRALGKPVSVAFPEDMPNKSSPW